MMHDRTLDRTTNCTGTVSELTYKQLKPCLLEDKSGDLTDFRIPTLKDALKWADKKTVLMLDVKRGVDFEKVLKEVEKEKAEDRVAIITYTPEAAAKVYQLHPNVMISTTIRNISELERIQKQGVPAENLMAFVGVKEPVDRLYQKLHEAGIYATLGTMGNLDRKAETDGNEFYGELVKNGADILSTDRPLDASPYVYGKLDQKSSNYKYFQKANSTE
jgi:glycerophosphoryl diester phosphodiesterase